MRESKFPYFQDCAILFSFEKYSVKSIYFLHKKLISQNVCFRFFFFDKSSVETFCNVEKTWILFVACKLFCEINLHCNLLMLKLISRKFCKVKFTWCYISLNCVYSIFREIIRFTFLLIIALYFIFKSTYICTFTEKYRRENNCQTDIIIYSPHLQTNFLVSQFWFQYD